MRILSIALKDLQQITRDKRSLLFLIAMPIVFTLFMGFAYGSGDSTAADERLALGWVDLGGADLPTTQLRTQLAAAEALRLVDLTAETQAAALNSGEVAGVLVIPAGFDANLSAADSAPLKLIADVNTPQGQALQTALRAAVTQVYSAAEIAQLSAGALGSSPEPAFAAAAQAWSESDNAAWIEVEAAAALPAWYGETPYNQASPGILVQFTLFGLVTSGQILVQERKSRTLQRMLSGCLHPAQIVAGHTLAMFALVFAQELLLVLFGQIVLGVDYARQPLAVLLVSAALGLWIAALGLLIGVLARDDSQVVLAALVAMFFFSALGGTWFPLEASSGAFAAIGGWLPSAWAMTGYQNILQRGLGLGSALQPALILLAYAAGTFGIAAWRFAKVKA